MINLIHAITYRIQLFQRFLTNITDGNQVYDVFDSKKFH